MGLNPTSGNNLPLNSRVKFLKLSFLVTARPQRQTNAKGCRIFGDLGQLKSKDTMQKPVNRADRHGEERKRNKTAVKLKQVLFLSSPWGSVYRFLHSKKMIPYLGLLRLVKLL